MNYNKNSLTLINDKESYKTREWFQPMSILLDKTEHIWPKPSFYNAPSKCHSESLRGCYFSFTRAPDSFQAKGFVELSKNVNEIISVMSYLRKTIVTIALANDFVQGGRVELYRLVALYHCILIV